jgi:hypothetical protein
MFAGNSPEKTLEREVGVAITLNFICRREEQLVDSTKYWLDETKP